MSIKKANSELDIIYNYYKDIKQKIKDNPSLDYLKDEFGNRQSISEQMYYFMQDFYSKSNNPQVISDEKYEKFHGDILYHGFRNIKHAANFLWDIRKHYGGGVFGSGFYLSDNIDDAIDYTEVEFSISSDKILQMKVDLENCKIIEYADLRKIANVIKSGYDIQYLMYYSFLGDYAKKKLRKLKSFIDEKKDMSFNSAFTYDESIMAIYLGFDAVRHESGTDNNYAILKPEKLFVSQSEFERVMKSAGGKYKEQIDFWRENNENTERN